MSEDRRDVLPGEGSRIHGVDNPNVGSKMRIGDYPLNVPRSNDKPFNPKIIKPENPDGVERAKEIALGQLSPTGEPLNININSSDTLASVNTWRERQGLPPVVKPGEKDKRFKREISEERIDLSKISEREGREQVYRLTEARRARERTDREEAWALSEKRRVSQQADKEEAARRSEERRQRERMDREAVERRLFTRPDNKIDKTRSSR